MKIEPYVSLEPQPHKSALFSIRLSDTNSSFDIHDISEAEIRKLIKDIEDQLESYIEVNSALQASIKQEVE